MDPVNIPAKFEVRSFTRSWDNRGTPKIGAVPVHAPFCPKILKGFCSDGRCEYTAKFEVRSFIRSWDNRGYSKNWGSPWMRPRSIFSQILKGFCSEGSLWIYLQNLKVRSFIRSGDNRGYSKNVGRPWICPHSIFSQIFNWLLFAWTLWIYLPNLTFVALPIPEIIGGTSKIWGVPGFAYAPYFPKFLKGFCSHGPCEYTCQSWSA